MAPALTEPLSPTEKLTNSTVTATTTPTTRSTRKTESISNKTSKNNSITVTNNNVIKSTQLLREKRRGSGITVFQTPSSSKRITRSRDHQQLIPIISSSSLNIDKKLEQRNITLKQFSKPSVQGSTLVSLNNNSSSTKNEQMGLSTTSLTTKNKILNNNSKKNNIQNLSTIDKSKDSSTAQLLADLTNEAITAEICLRNQLKDVNLVKTTSDSSSLIQQDKFDDTDIVVLKFAPPTASEINKTSAHMEAQFDEASRSSQVQDTLSESTTAKETFSPKRKENFKKLSQEHEKDENTHKNDESSAIEKVENNMDIAIHESPVASPNSEDSDTKKISTETSKLEVICVQELPPVNTDSTMTASEVEDNLEERLSQLDGTAIDSPPPNHDISKESNEKNSQNSAPTATPPHTPTHHQTLTQDLQELQQQLQHTPPTPVSQQVQAHIQQHHQNQQQTNCFTPQSTTSSINSLSTGNISQSFIKEADGSAAELEDQDIEEVFKVLKGFEGGTTSDLNVCDLNVLFNEVYMKINETEMSGNANSGGNIVGGGPANSQNNVTVANPSIQLVKPTEIEEGQMEIEKRQQQMQRKIDFLIRRLRKIQARYMCKHTSEEIAGLFEWSARQTSKGATNTTPLQNNENIGAETITQDQSKYFFKIIAARPPPSEWKDVHESLVPANQITALLRKIESVANAQQLCTTPSASLVNITNKKTKKAAAAAAAASSNTAVSSLVYGGGKAEEVVVTTLEENVSDELTQVTGLLQSEMSEVQKAVDSDATESSSGGESADEMVTYNNTQQQTLPITKRAAWRYSRDRAAIASRWSWLLSQISDLEIKIRQHSELHQEIARSKGLVTCCQSEKYKVDTNIGKEDKEELVGSCRTRGYIPSQFRKRKLIQTTNIHTISKKAARPSTIKCGCQWPLHPCALCTGRLDPTAPRDLPDTMMMSDRIALLDSGYHPVLSFRENVNNALHFEAIAKQPEWQQRVLRCQAKNIARSVWRAEREAVAAATGGHHLSLSRKYSEAPPTKRRYIKKKDRLNNEDKIIGGKSSNVISGSQLHAATPLTSTPGTTQPVTSSSTTSLNDVGNGTATLSSTPTTSSTTALVANRGTTNSAKKQHWPKVGDRNLKDPMNSLLPPPCMDNTNLTATSTTMASNNLFIHQTSDCHPTNYDQFNPNQTPSLLISNSHNTNNIRNYKHRKLSSSTANSNLYNLSNNNSGIHNGDPSNVLGHEFWGVPGDNFVARSRTSSPIHGGSSNSYYKYERSLDRKNRASYDIDNIVIPYSVAATTRVEILPYKEIPTPKWRVIENYNEGNNTLKISKYLIPDTKTLEPIKNGNCYQDKKIDLKKDHLLNNEEKMKSEFHCKSDGLKDIDLQVKNNSDENKGEDITDNSKIFKKNSLTNTSTRTSLNNNIEKEQDKKEKHRNDDENTDESLLKRRRIQGPRTMDIEKVEREVEAENKDKHKLENNSKISMREDEDISDDAMFLRHERALIEERRKFQTYLKFPWSTRSRANRRIDSRAESSGANTPDPSSPAPQTPSVCGGDQESIPSPSNSATPLNLTDTISEAGDNSTSFLGVGTLPTHSGKRFERRRTTSSKRDRELERRSSTPDSKEIAPPYEPLIFPLTDEQFGELLRAMPSDYNEDSKRFDDCYLPGGGSGGSLQKNLRSISGGTSKRTSKPSILCGDGTSGGRRVRHYNKTLKPISADDSNISPYENGAVLYDEEYYDDHLAPDDHLTADSIGNNRSVGVDGIYDDDDVYGDHYGAYVGNQQRKHRDSNGESSEDEPFQDDDPNDPEWRGETEERLRKKV